MNILTLLRFGAPILLLLGVVFYHVGAVKSAYNRGMEEERKIHSELVNKIETENLKVTYELNNEILRLSNELKLEETKRQEKEIVFVKEIETIVRDNTKYQECKVDEDLRDLRNLIRSEGPRP